jgi:hypothetical protein
METLTLLAPLEGANLNPVKPVSLVTGAYAVLVVSKESRRLVLPRTSCYISVSCPGDET